MVFPAGLKTHVAAEARLEGHQELQARLASLPLALRLRIGVDVVAAGGHVLLGPMREAAPDETLKESIDLVVRTYPDRGITMSLTGPRWPEGAHAVWREFGTADRFTRDGVYRGRMPATPFVGPTFERLEGTVQRVMAAELTRGLEAHFGVRA